MIIVEINATRNGSTGLIMYKIAEVARENEIQVFTIYGGRRGEKKYSDDHNIMASSYFDHTIHRLIGKITGYNDLLSKNSTRKVIKRIQAINPDIIHLHIVHGHYLCFMDLFKYLDKINKPVIWTLHDCWAFTGRCPHFVLSRCNKWKTGCYDCPYPKNNYPASIVDKSRQLWNLKKRVFCKIKDMTIVTPSAWLARLVGQSFLKNYPTIVINNGIDLNVFKPTPSNFKQINNMVSSFVILGVANCWNRRKGIDVFVRLAAELPNKYKIVLVGTNKTVDENLPKNIVSIHRTANQSQLAELYSTADLFVNPTREDNFPTVNIEALACGTPVLTFKTGGSPEIIDETCGCSIEQDDYDSLIHEIKRICTTRPYNEESCINRAKRYDMDYKYNEYVELYKKIYNKEI